MSTIVIKVDGTDITDDVIISGASFSSLVNGSPGLAKLRVKDVDQTYEFTSGGLLTLDVNSVRVWGGYIMAARKVYALSVIDTDVPPSATRMWEIAGVDHNILFTKRIVFKESDPSNKVDFSYDADTYDDTIINDIFDNYLDIATDGLTRTGVQRIAKAILDVPGKIHSGKIASAGFTWKQMMDNVQRATGGIYYLDAERDLKYVDVETSTSSYTLTDQPAGGSDVGYQGFTLLENGSNLVNDMFVWGAGNGSNEYVFSRTEDSASIAEHGRWQLPLVTTGLFRQASADIMADSYVYGTPQSHRGGKDNAVSFTCRVFEPLFAAGDVVDVVNGIYGYSDALPIRSMTATFASPTDPIFDLVLSHAIDQPVGISEFADLIAAGDKPKGDPLDPWKPLPPVTEGSCSDAVCGITDDFTRTETNTWGTATCGLDWVTDVVAPNTINVNGTAGTIYVTGTINNTSVSMSLGAGAPGRSFPVDDSVKTMHFQIPDFTPLGTTNSYFLVWSPMDHPGLVFGPTIGISADDTLPIVRSFIDYTKFHTGGGAGDIPGTFWNSSSTYTWTVWKTPTGQAQSITNGSSTYSSSTGSDPTYAQLSLTWSAENNSVAPATLRVLDIDVPEITRCTLTQFDDFDRNVTGGAGSASDWGVASGGLRWSPDPSSSSATWMVETANGGGMVWASGGSSAPAMSVASSPIGAETDFTMTFTGAFYPPVSDLTLGNYYQFRLEDSGGGNVWQAIVAMYDASSGGLSGPGILLGYFDGSSHFERFAMSITTGAIYVFQWQKEGSTHRMRMWQQGTTVPAWQVEQSGLPTFDIAKFSIDTQLRPNCEMDVRSIDFDYDGRPCYLDCSGITDTFTRTVASGWGTSDAGIAWDTSFAAAADVTGGEGHLAIPASENDSAGMSLTGNLTNFLLATRYEGTYTDPSGSVFYFYVDYLGNSLYVDIYPNGDVDFYTNNFYPGEETTLSFDPSTPFSIRFVITSATTADLYIWETSDAEPGTPTLSLTDGAGDLGIATDRIFVGAFADTGTTADVYVDALDIVGITACSGVGPAVGVPPTGYVCETIDHGITGLFSTAQAFFAGSLQVWVNGLLNIPVYTTPSAGTFELDPALTPSDTLRVCYNANGDPVS